MTKPEAKSISVNTPTVAIRPSRSKSAKKPPYPVDASKQDRILALLQRDIGASIAELQSATNWQAHSMRGFLSATVRKKLQLPLVAELRATGERVYRLTGGNDA